MADAANIILNLSRNPYRVMPQKSIFGTYVRPDRDPIRDLSGVLTTVQSAKKIADAVAPFFAKGYDAPAQQAEAAQAKLKSAEQTQQQTQAALQQAQQAQQTEKFGGLMGLKQAFAAQPQAQPTDAQANQLLQANEMLQRATTPEEVEAARQAYQAAQAGQPLAPPPVYEVDPRTKPGKAELSNAQVIAMMRANEMLQNATTPEEVAAARQAYEAAQAGQTMLELQNERGQEEAQQEAARREQVLKKREMLESQTGEAQTKAEAASKAAQAAQAAAKKAGDVLPTFNTIAEAESAIKSALIDGDMKTARKMVEGLKYSKLTDVRAKDLFESLNPAVPRKREIGAMMKRLNIGRFQAIKEQQKGREAADARQKAMIEARIKAATEKYNREKELIGDRAAERRKTNEKRHNQVMDQIAARNKGALKRARVAAWATVKRAKVSAKGQLDVALQRGINQNKGTSRKYLLEHYIKKSTDATSLAYSAEQYLAATSEIKEPPAIDAVGKDGKPVYGYGEGAAKKYAAARKPYDEVQKRRAKAQRVLDQNRQLSTVAFAVVDYIQKNPGKYPTTEVLSTLTKKAKEKGDSKADAPKGWKEFVGGMPTSVGSPAGTGN